MAHNKNLHKIMWKVGNLSADLASVRYRAILPIIALREEGMESSLTDTSHNVNLDTFDALIIVKSFTSDDLFLAQQACILRKIVVFDLCDNIFIKDYRGKQPVIPAEMFMAILPYLSAVTVTTGALKEVVDRITNEQVPCFILPDGIETNKEYAEAKKIISNIARMDAKRNLNNLYGTIKNYSSVKKEILVEVLKSNRQHLKSNIKSLARPITWVNKLYTVYDIARAKTIGVPRKTSKPIPLFSADIYLQGKKISKKEIPITAKKIVWFGNHGAKYAKFGMLDLLPLRNALEKLHQEYPLELVVISNNRERFLKYIAQFNCFTRYVEWSASAVSAVLETSNACLVPNSKDEFSICKSANRTVLSLNANVPVIATLTPSLNELADAIYWQDPYEGLLECFREPGKAKQKVVLGKKLIKDLYGNPAIAKAGIFALNNARKSQVCPSLKAKIVIALHLIQDYELAKPLITRLEEAQQSYCVWLSASLARKAARVLHWLTTERINYVCLPDEIATINPEVFKQFEVEKFVTFAETNLGPHKFTHTLTKLANNQQLATYTFQHGFENIGITYSDQVHDIRNIEIAASKVLTWGPDSTLHPGIKSEIKKNVVPVGCIKPVWPDAEHPTPIDAESGIIIGIFENLHWHRYSSQYQETFLRALDMCAEKFPEIKFFIKPHPAGMWLTSRYKGELPVNSNIIIADPADPAWERPLLSDYFRKLDGVISTPSTVILDAARANLPTLVCGFDLILDNYSPLLIANNGDDWVSFVQQISSKNTTELESRNIQFVQKVLIPDDAITNVISLITA